MKYNECGSRPCVRKHYKPYCHKIVKNYEIPDGQHKHALAVGRITTSSHASDFGNKKGHMRTYALFFYCMKAASVFCNNPVRTINPQLLNLACNRVAANPQTQRGLHASAMSEC